MSGPTGTSIRYIKGVGESREKLFAKLGLETLGDLVGYFPRAYEDRTRFKKTNQLTIGETVCVAAMASCAPQLSHIRKGLDIVRLRAVDETGSLDLTFFNQPFIKDAIKPGVTYVFYGKVEGTLTKPAMANPLFEKVDSEQGDSLAALFSTDEALRRKESSITGRIMPIYALTAGLSQKMVFSAVRYALDKCADELPGVLPSDIARKYELCASRYAYENIHFPEDELALEIARKRLIFEEIFVLVTAMRLLREKRVQKTGKRLEPPDWNEFYGALSFSPTGAQIRAIEDAARDMEQMRAMNRLVQGDVGSGKTLVAAACCFMTFKSGCQSAFMAPTEILAKQHYSTLLKLLEPLGMKVELLTGSMTAKRKREIYGRLGMGEIDLIIGTHALISDGVHFKNLALVITDEQHRFGVNQRSMLSEKGDNPHVLVMSATPIPRTLALIIYGDLDVSIIDEMPPGRRPIETYIVGEKHRQRMYDFVRKLVLEGRQAYIICPMVDEQEQGDEGLRSAIEYHRLLKEDIFPDLRVELVHGKMKSKDKDKAMAAFSAGEADVLVATTVVEVGVDVPNAALIVIENAERFGLSQLHQLRGRVGRGEHDSYCVLFRGAGLRSIAERLEVMKSTNDGFKIAEEDLKLRGPGDFFGSRQHGLPEMKIAQFANDMYLLGQAQNAANENLRSDPQLREPENRALLRHIEKIFEVNAEKLN